MRHRALQDLLHTLPPHPLKTVARAVNAMLQPESPLLAQLVVIRRCNLEGVATQGIGSRTVNPCLLRFCVGTASLPLSSL